MLNRCSHGVVLAEPGVSASACCMVGCILYTAIKEHTAASRNYRDTDEIDM